MPGASVKDIDFERREIAVRRGKGAKDRVSVLPSTLVRPLQVHLQAVKSMHEADLARGLGRVVLPDALRAKYPNADRSWPWQFVFPAARVCRDRRFGAPTRFHLHESAIQRAVTAAVVRAGIPKRELPHAAALVRNAPARRRARHPHDPGTARARRREHDDDLHARAEQGRAGVRSPADLL
jgi:integrase